MQTLKRIDELNEGEPFRPHGINQFADLTQEEFAARFAPSKRPLKAQMDEDIQIPVLEVESGDLPDTFDWRTKGSYVTPIKTDGECGRCSRLFWFCLSSLQLLGLKCD